MKSASVLAVLVAALTAPAAAATLRVPRDFGTIQEAIDAAADGDTVLVSSGVYEENVDISGRTGLVLRAKGRAVITANDEGDALSISDSSVILVRGFELRRADHAVAIDGSTRVTVTQCHVHDTASDGIRADASSFVEVSRCRIEDTGADGVALAVSNADGPVTDARVTGNRFERVGDDAVDFHGDRNVIDGNTVLSTAEDGIEIDADERGSGNRIERNRISGVPGVAIALHGDTNVCRANRVTGCGGDGIEVDGTGNDVSRNRITEAGGDGIWLPGAGNTVDRNGVKAPGDDGFDDEAGGQTFTRNKVSKAAGHGFEIGGTGNDLRRNAAKGSAGFDLADLTGEAGANSYAKSNHFQTRSVPE